MALSLLLLFIFLAASLGVAAGYSVWRDLRQRDAFRARQRLETEFQKEQTKPTSPISLFKSVSQYDLGEINGLCHSCLLDQVLLSAAVSRRDPAVRHAALTQHANSLDNREGRMRS